MTTPIKKVITIEVERDKRISYHERENIKCYLEDLLGDYIKVIFREEIHYK